MAEQIDRPYTPAQVREILGVDDTTLRRWERGLLLVPWRTFGGHRRFARRQVDALAQREKPAS